MLGNASPEGDAFAGSEIEPNHRRKPARSKIPPRIILSPNGCPAQDAADKAGTSMHTSNGWIGIDVSKRFLDVEIAGQAPARLANCDAGRGVLVERLKSVPVAGVVVEATGGLERPVIAALLNAGLPASIVNPARVRAFAEGTGRLAKTDRIDAKVLASYGAYMRPAPAQLPTAVRCKAA